MTTSTGPLASARKALWHLREGGFPQLREHLKRRRRGTVVTWKGDLFTRADDGSMLFHPFQWPKSAPRRDLRVGTIADDFTRAAFGYEWQSVLLKPSTWREQVDGIDLLFVESAWHGNHDTWQYQLTGSKAPTDEVRALVAACRERGIPTVFWNKEDPTHFEDFLDSARLFDHVLTTDASCVPRYRESLGHDRVDVLPFAVQERIVNPVRRLHGEHERGIAFAGTWFNHKYPERRDQMRLLFDAALEAEDDENRFEIFSRFLGDDERYQFPSPYAERVVGSLSFDQMLSAYRAYKVFLNVNTVTDSETMFARRLLEITACGTPVVTTPTPAIRAFLGDGVAQVDSTPLATLVIDELLHDRDAARRLVHLGQRELWRSHTYSHRVDQVLQAVGLPGAMPPSNQVSVVMSTKRPHQLDHALEQVARQSDVEIQWLLGAHGFEVGADFRDRAAERGVDLQALSAPDDWPLGRVLNALVERSDAPIVSKMDDDDLYFEHYLSDLLAAQRITGADVVGKYERWVHLAQRDLTVLASEGMAWRPSNLVAGPTITTTRDVARQVSFPALNRSEDTGFLQAVTAAGGTIIATDPFNFVQMRQGADGGHSWNVEDDHFLGAERQLPGIPRQLVVV
ncbi:glycosyltransferase family protein [Luteococcus sp. Sow4_B9]|uniref:glycosyltransferase family protein n=1 Tax=Luteococcus sp. Sow4_B9 TaxID=3438792 RepID=UPI003F9AC91E